jgi:hypothetical protein
MCGTGIPSTRSSNGITFAVKEQIGGIEWVCA